MIGGKSEYGETNSYCISVSVDSARDGGGEDYGSDVVKMERSELC